LVVVERAALVQTQAHRLMVVVVVLVDFCKQLSTFLQTKQLPLALVVQFKQICLA
jgi:hypothetical protein